MVQPDGAGAGGGRAPMNYFEVFDLPRRLTIDTDALQRRFYELSRQTHPDFHHGGTPEAQARALTSSALVNAAYRALRDPIARIEYLVRLEEGGQGRPAAAVTPEAPPELLEEMFEIQEALQEATSGGLDEAGRSGLAAQRDRLLGRQDEEEARLRGPLAEAWDAAAAEERPRALARLREALATRAYLRTVIDDLTEALGEGDARDVAHRRH